MNHGFEAAYKNIENPKNYEYAPFINYIKVLMDHTIIIHLWNLVGTSKNNKHNLYTYIEDVKNNIDDYVKTFLHTKTVEGFVDPIKEIKESIEHFEEYHKRLNSGDNPFSLRLKSWRNKVYAHIDKNPGISHFMPLNNSTSNWVAQNEIRYSEIEDVCNKLWDMFHKIDNMLFSNVSWDMQSIASKAMMILIDKNEATK